ncbi:MAG: 50S ribosomal protein L9 [Firmicutes bacterium]|jgi:large subunit ribosomal protein L9|nr:50S ribosomal protein L9 [Bacillota bacterium]
MQVILVRDVKNLGVSGEVVNVADGYARNYLIPRGLAVPATEGGLRQVKTRQAAEQQRREKEAEEAAKLVELLDGGKVEVLAKCGEGGRLFGSVTSADIAAAIKDQYKTEIDKRKVELAEPIKTVGSHQVTIRVYPGMTAVVTVEVKEAK